jgi:signal transduction histidine kinase
MWKNLSFRTRLFLPLGIMFAVALVMGGVSVVTFTTGQLVDENEPALRSAKVVADALNGALQVSHDPQQTLDAFVQSLGTSTAIQFRPAGSAAAASPPQALPPQPAGAPRWFIDLLTLPNLDIAFPVAIDGHPVGDIRFSPDLSVELFEKWIGFVAFASFVIVMTALTGAIAYATAGSALRSLQNLGGGLTRMRHGNYKQLIPVSGPVEIRQSCEEANELARTLSRLNRDNRSLLRRIVSLQDDERRDLARELHDELGPLLFGIRANAIALQEAAPAGKESLASSAQNVLQSVEALQHANRRILDRLRPLYIQELGLERSIETLLQNFRTQAPQIALTPKIDARLNQLDGPLSQTVYRVTQEALTNILRHAGASHAEVRASVDGEEIALEISDDGGGFPADKRFGRGLTGMQERVRALSGSLQLLQAQGRTFVRCRLPIGDTLSQFSSSDSAA